MRKKLTQEYLKECLTYDPETGIFTWNIRPESHFKDGINQPKSATCKVWNSRWSGKNTGSAKDDKYGYLIITLNSRTYPAHRLAFLYMDGYLPENEVDHINRNPKDNRWSNLREVSKQCNGQNCNLSKNNTSGVTGIFWNNQIKKWAASITILKKTIYLGCFESFDEAVMRRYYEELTNPQWTCSVESTSYIYLRENNLLEAFNKMNFTRDNLISTNTSGVTGVIWVKRLNMWFAQIIISKKHISLGYFDKFEDAVMARYNEELTNLDFTMSVESSAYRHLRDNNLLDVFASKDFSEKKLKSTNTSGVEGVHWEKSRNKFVAQMRILKKNTYLGRYSKFEDAVMRRYQEEINNPNFEFCTSSSAYKYLKDHNLI